MNMTKDEFKNLLDDLADGTGFDLDKVQKEFAYMAAVKYHESEVKKLNFPDVSKCAKCNDEYQRGIEDGKIIAEHGTVNWID